MPARWSRDLLLLVSLSLAGASLGSALQAGGLGLAIGILCYQSISYRRALGLHRWLSEDSLQRDPPAYGGMLGEMADRMHYQHLRMQRRLDEMGDALAHLHESYAVLNDGVVMLDVGNAIEWCNASACRLLGLRFPEDLGQQLVNLVRVPEFAAYLDGENAHKTFELHRVPRVLEVQATPFGVASKVVFVRDVSAMRYLETMRRDFIANISHELRTPLTVISGYVDTLAQMPEARSAPLERALGQMQTQARRMECLLRDLMLLSKMESSADAASASEERIELRAMLESVRENALAACGGERDIELDCARELRFRGERAALDSVVSNLVFNAVRYTAAGGRIRLRFVRNGLEGLFEVQDNGIGIDPVHIPRLTERFYRVDPSRAIENGGTGLGLAIVKHALKRLDGELVVSSRPGMGSTFSCRFRGERIGSGSDG